MHHLEKEDGTILTDQKDILNETELYYKHLYSNRETHQTGFIKGRSIVENIRVIYDIMNFTDEQHIPGLLLFIDFEKHLILYHGISYIRRLSN